MTLAEYISTYTRELIIDKDAIVMGQCLTAVGWVAGTIPPLKDHPNIIELPMADVAGGGFAVGAALNEARPVIYVIRYQGFLWYNAISIANYAAKSFELFGVPCPLIVRAIGMEGGIGPVAGNSHLSLLLRMPGLNIFAPMTIAEWKRSMEFHFEQSKNPTIIGEHRASYSLTIELKDYVYSDARVNLLAIGASRLNARTAHDDLKDRGIKVNLFNLYMLSPLTWPEGLLESVTELGSCIIIDSDFEKWGPSQNIAYMLSSITKCKIELLGLQTRSAGFSKATDNVSPSAQEIIQKVQQTKSY